jgi:TetR/AcrR family transcriptional regulator, cholesterol catabolism regulator
MVLDENLTRKEQVIRKAAELFSQKGYAASSMRDLANALGIEAASLYSHIKSKEEILQYLCFTMADEFIRSLDEVDNMEISSLEKIRLGIIGHTKVILKDLAASAVFLNEFRSLSQPHLRKFLLLRIHYINRFKRIIEDAIQAGEIKPVDKKLAVITIFSSLSWIPLSYDPMGAIDREEISKQLAHLLIHGLKQN